MKKLLIFFAMAVVAVTTNAKELKSFLGVKFGESVHQDKFIAFDNALKSKGMSPSAINPSVYAAFKGTYIYMPSKPFKNYDEVLVKANANGEVYYVGVLEFFKGEQHEKKMRDCFENARWILSTYGSDAIKITDKAYPELHNKLKNNLANGMGDSALHTELFFGFQNSNNTFPSQIVTSSVSFDCESGKGVVAMFAEDIALENASARETQANGKRASNAPQLSRAQALLSKDKAKKQAVEESRQKGLDSFCGIEFGSRFTGDMQRTRDGRYLTALVRLNAPFKGKQIVKIYASVTTRRIFSVEFPEPEANDFSQWDLVPTVSKRYGFEPEIWKDFAGRSHCRWNFSNACIYFVQHGTTISSEFPGAFSATHRGWSEIADEEFEKESGGDGSSVL